jgi:C4-dicarboxylate-specific signal transduction histidine kinase
MTTDVRRAGIDVIGNIAWGTHFCLFYDTKNDLLDTLAAYCKAGLESGEFCLWVIAAPVMKEEALDALRGLLPDADRHVAEGSVEIVPAREWYLDDGVFNLARVICGWNEKLAYASARGFSGVRVTGDTAWLERKDWRDFVEYEESLNDAIANQRLAVLCTYPLSACGAGEILDVVRTHQFAIARRRGTWDVIETAGYKQAKAEIKRLNHELEQRVEHRTRQLTALNEELRREVLERQRAEDQARAERERVRQAHADLAHVSRVTTMGELTASLTHEVKQPIAAASTDAKTCLRWLERKPPDVLEARGAAARVIRDVGRAADIITRISALFNKRDLARQIVDVNDLIREMALLLHSEADRYSVALRLALCPALPLVTADPVQLQQVFMNLMLNGIDAMKSLDRPRILTIASEQTAPAEVLIRISDTGVGVPLERVDKIFEAFFTTKPSGIGMGLPISRSIIESHGGRLWVEAARGAGTCFHFLLPAATEVTA